MGAFPAGIKPLDQVAKELFHHFSRMWPEVRSVDPSVLETEVPLLRRGILTPELQKTLFTAHHNAFIANPGKDLTMPLLEFHRGYFPVATHVMAHSLMPSAEYANSDVQEGRSAPEHYASQITAMDGFFEKVLQLEDGAAAYLRPHLPQKESFNKFNNSSADFRRGAHVLFSQAYLGHAASIFAAGAPALSFSKNPREALKSLIAKTSAALDKAEQYNSRAIGHFAGFSRAHDFVQNGLGRYKAASKLYDALDKMDTNGALMGYREARKHLHSALEYAHQSGILINSKMGENARQTATQQGPIEFLKASLMAICTFPAFPSPLSEENVSHLSGILKALEQRYTPEKHYSIVVPSGRR